MSFCPCTGCLDAEAAQSKYNELAVWTHHTLVALGTESPHTDSVTVAVGASVGAAETPVLQAPDCLVPDESRVTRTAPEGALQPEPEITVS